MDTKSELQKMQRRIDTVSSEIDRLEEEYQYLLEENKKNNIRIISEKTKSAIKDSRLRGVFGKDAMKKAEKVAEDFLSGDFLDKDVWNKSMDDITATLVALHRKQIFNYEKLEALYSKVEFIFDESEERIYKDTIRDAKRAYEEMADTYTRVSASLKKIYNRD